MQTATPGIFERVEPKMVEKDHLGDHARAPTVGNLYATRDPHVIQGGWRERKSTPVLPILAVSALGAIALVGSAALLARAA